MDTKVCASKNEEQTNVCGVPLVSTWHGRSLPDFLGKHSQAESQGLPRRRISAKRKRLNLNKPWANGTDRQAA